MKRPEGFDPSPQKPEVSAGPRRSPRAPRARARKVDASEVTAAPVNSVVSRASADPDHRARIQKREARAARRVARAEARRFTRSTRRRRLTVLGAGGVVVVLLGVLAIAVFSPILALRTISVQGTSAIPSAQVKHALSSQLGTPLALLDESKIHSQLSRIILIRSYVTEVVPPGTLVVRIVERKAIAALPAGSGYQQVDPAGVILARSATPGGLPVIDIGSAGANSPGFAAAVKVLLAMPASVLAQVSSVSATTLDNVSLTLNQGNHTVIWGSAAQSDLKGAALATLLKNCASQPVLNVTAPLALACGPQQVAPTPSPTSTPSP